MLSWIHMLGFAGSAGQPGAPIAALQFGVRRRAAVFTLTQRRTTFTLAGGGNA